MDTSKALLEVFSTDAQASATSKALLEVFSTQDDSLFECCISKDVIEVFSTSTEDSSPGNGSGTYRPIVQLDGVLHELPMDAELDCSSVSQSLFPVPVVGKATHTVFKDEELPELVFSSDGDIVFALVSSEDL